MIDFLVDIAPWGHWGGSGEIDPALVALTDVEIDAEGYPCRATVFVGPVMEELDAGDLVAWVEEYVHPALRELLRGDERHTGWSTAANGHRRLWTMLRYGPLDPFLGESTVP